MPNPPILLLASGQRTGSTLLQRFLLSHPRMMIWGEHDGVLGAMLQRYERLYEWDGMFAHHLESFQASGYNNFIPNLTPPLETIQAGFRAMVEALYQQPALAMGRDLWGFKEVLYDAEAALRFRALYPGLRVIYITRHPFGAFTSLLHEERLKASEVNIPLKDIWTRRKTIQWVQTWAHINASFLEHPAITEDWVYKLTYEALIADIPAQTRRLSAWLGLPLADFDLDVFNHRLYTDRANAQADRQDTRPKITWDDLTAEEYSLLTDPEVIRVAGLLGYTIP
ncbi:MAG: sulfotransferase [Phototrophicaceae bacterium]|jgi:hypothetical protein